MNNGSLGRWLRGLQIAAQVIRVVALCLGVALLVLAFIPGSPVSADLPVTALSGLDAVGGVAGGVTADPDGSLTVRVADASLPQRLLYLATLLPGLLLIAEIARRLARLLRSAARRDPFHDGTPRELSALAKITVAGGLAVWIADVAAQWVLSTTILSSGGAAAQTQGAPLTWLAVGFIFAAFGQVIARGVAMRSELDAVI